MGARIGLDGSLVRRSGGTYSSPTWDVIGNVKDLAINIETGEAEVTTRLNGGWKAFLQALTDATIEWESVWDSADADLLALLTAWRDKAVIDFAAMDAPIAVGNAGALGVRFEANVYLGTINQPLAEGQTVQWKIRPSYSANVPKLVKVDNTGALVAF